MARYKIEPDDLLAIIKKLEDRLSKLERNPQLGNSSVDKGSMTVYSGQGDIRFIHNDGVTEMVHIGLLQTVFGPVDLFQVSYLNGAPMVQMFSNLLGFETWSFFDSSTNMVVGADPKVDGVSNGTGLARPYITTPFVTAGTPTDTTASGTFTTLQRCMWRKQHPAIEFWVRHNVTATTGEVQFVVAGEVIAGPTTIPAGSGWLIVGPALLPDIVMNIYEIEAQFRVASGAGNVAGAVIAYGREKP